MGDAMGCESVQSRFTLRQPAIIGVLVPFPPAGHAEPSRTLPTLSHGVAWRGLGGAPLPALIQQKATVIN